MNKILSPSFTLKQVMGILPAANDEEFNELLADIKANGQKMPIIMDGEMIVDGRARMKACETLGVTPLKIDISEVPGASNDPAMLALSLNLKRRQLNVAQRSLIAAQLAGLQKGSNQHTKGQAFTRKQAAELLSVSEDSIDRANKVIAIKSKPLLQLVKTGEISLSNAAKLASAYPEPKKLTVDSIKDLLDLGLERFKRKHYNAEVLDKKRTEASKLIENNQAALEVLKGTYSVIYADPPWDYGGNTKNAHFDPSAHYPLMKLEDIKKLPVKQCLASDAALFLWVPNCLIPSGLEVLQAWGFTYVTCMVWCKDNVVTSSSVTYPAHETLLIGKKGSGFHVSEKVLKSWHHEKITKHSKKPEYFAQMIEALYPGFPKLEMFAREPRSEEWKVFGNEVIDNVEQLVSSPTPKPSVPTKAVPSVVKHKSRKVGAESTRNANAGIPLKRVA